MSSEAPDERRPLLPGRPSYSQADANAPTGAAEHPPRERDKDRHRRHSYGSTSGRGAGDVEQSDSGHGDRRSRSRRVWSTAQRVCSPNVLLLVALLAAIAWLITARELRQKPHRKARAYREQFHNPPDVPLDPDGIKVDGPRPDGEHAVTAIVIHGLSDTSHGLFWPPALGPRFPFVKWVAPQARWMNITVNNGAWLSAWYDITSFDDLHKHEDETGMIESQRELNELIRAERKILVDKGREPRIVVCGFSQGAVMTLLNVLAAKEPIDAAMMLAGYLPIPRGSKRLARLADRNTPIFWAHGTADPYLAEQKAAQDVRTLRHGPFSFHDLEYKTYDGVGHYWTDEIVQDFSNWFDTVVERRGAGSHHFWDDNE